MRIKQPFIDKMIGALETNKALLISKEWDPTQRVTNLRNGAASVTGDKGIISNLEQTLTVANATRRADLDNHDASASASASIGSVEGAIGKDHPLVKDMRQIRGAMSRASGSAKTAAPK